MAKAETVAQSFETYRANVLPKDAPPVQVNECRRAFYAGSYFMLMSLALNIGDDSTSEDDGIEQLEALKAECEAFAASGGMPLPQPELTTEPITAPDINYTVPDPLDMQATLKQLGDVIGEALPNGWGFNLLLFTYGEKGSLFYISSAQRVDVLNVMREFIKRQTQ